MLNCKSYDSYYASSSIESTSGTYFIATPPDRGWQRNEGLLLLHSFLSLDILVAFSILRFGRLQVFYMRPRPPMYCIVFCIIP